MTVGEPAHFITVAGEVFELRAARQAPEPVWWPAGHEALCIFVHSSWLHSPVDLLNSVLAHETSFDDVIAIGFHDASSAGDPDDVVSDLDDIETYVSEAFFDAYVIAYAELAVATSATPPSDEVRALVERARARVPRPVL